MSSPHGSTSVVHVDGSSVACTPSTELACAHGCDAEMAAQCTFDFEVTLEECVAGCVQNLDFFPNCAAEWAAYNECVGRLSPDPSNWICIPDFPPAFPADTVCPDEVNALIECIIGP